MRFYFVRHGESKANVLGIISNRGLSYGLTELGRQQAHTLAESLVGVGVTRIYTSSLLRAVQTAEILAQVLAVPYESADALREFDCGVLEGKSDAVSWQTNQAVFETWTRGEDWDIGIEQGESLEDIIGRFVPFIYGLTSDLPPESVVVLVGHGGTYRCALPFVLSNLELSFTAVHGLTNAMMVVAETSPAGLTCLSWGRNGVRSRRVKVSSPNPTPRSQPGGSGVMLRVSFRGNGIRRCAMLHSSFRLSQPFDCLAVLLTLQAGHSLS